MFSYGKNGVENIKLLVLFVNFVKTEALMEWRPFFIHEWNNIELLFVLPGVTIPLSSMSKVWKISAKSLGSFMTCSAMTSSGIATLKY